MFSPFSLSFLRFLNKLEKLRLRINILNLYGIVGVDITISVSEYFTGETRNSTKDVIKIQQLLFNNLQY